jgi:hypothetical protein
MSTDLAKLRELLARVESATGGHRDLDYALHDMSMDGWLQRHGYERREDADGYRTNTPPFEGARYCAGPEAFTSSIDAAVQLCECVLPGWVWRVGQSTLYPGWATVNRLHQDHCDRNDDAFAKGALPSLALCAAILRAKISQLENA